MMRAKIGAASLTLLLLAACSTPHPVAPLSENPEGSIELALDPVLDDTGPGAGRLLIVALSGGGKRAAAFAQGALNAMAGTLLTDGRTMLDEIDILSSTSGGSVTAANFALNGRARFDAFEDNFLMRDFMPRLYWELLNPIAFVSKVLVHNDRIESLVGVLEETVFADATLSDVWPRKGAPYLILNATDASSGLTFSMTQHYFDLICADARPYPLARAVASSAAYPVALSPIVLENKCSGPPEGERRKRLAQYLQGRFQLDPERSGPTAAPGDAAGRSWALRYHRLLNGETDARYVHLFDGGISDNLGLSEPLRLLTSHFHGNPFVRAVRSGPVNDLVILVVDSRSSSQPGFERTGTPPNLFETLFSVIGGTIDSRMSGLTVQASLLKAQEEQINAYRCARAGVNTNEKICLEAARAGQFQRLKTDTIVLAFDNLEDASCRRGFAELPTDWGLTQPQVRALMNLGEGTVSIDPRFQKLAQRAEATISPEALTRRGEQKIEEACACFRGEKAPCR